MLPARSPRTRRGAALPFALMMLVVLTAIAGGSFAMSRQAFRGGRNAMIEQRAFSVAEAGLNRQIANWNSALNLPGTAGGVNPGQTVTSSIWVALGDTARVRVTRLDQALFWVESFGRASIPNPALQAQRTVGALVRIAYPTITPQGAITTNGNVDIQGNAFTVDGRDEIPFAGSGTAWGGGRCTDLTGPDVAAIAVPPGAKVDYNAGNVAGGLPVLYTPTAADPNTYIAFGTETMNTMIQNADLKYSTGVTGTAVNLSNDIAPRLRADGECDVGHPTNWGEPWGAGGVAKCRDYFPIIYVDGTTEINGNGRGQGVLIVNGDLRINGNFTWLGLVLVKDDMNKGNGNATITGAVMARNVDLTTGSVFGGSQQVQYSRCAVETALRGSAILIRVRDRAWSQLF
jgi:hypothetical protein